MESTGLVVGRLRLVKWGVALSGDLSSIAMWRSEFGSVSSELFRGPICSAIGESKAMQLTIGIWERLSVLVRAVRCWNTLRWGNPEENARLFQLPHWGLIGKLQVELLHEAICSYSYVFQYHIRNDWFRMVERHTFPDILQISLTRLDFGDILHPTGFVNFYGC